MQTVNRNSGSVRLSSVFAGVALLMISVAASADELVETIQKDLTSLGYYSDEIDGDLDLPTQLAIGKFEEANSMPVTGEASLAIASKIGLAAQVGGETASAPDAGSVNEEVAAARQQCLDDKKAEAEAKKKKKRLWGKLGKAGGNLLGRFGNAGIATDIYKAGATAEDVAAIGEAMGLDEAAVQECMAIGADSTEIAAAG